ncbi:MAG TPA: hypothetical protein VF113_06225 [Stellaceae bacterium]
MLRFIDYFGAMGPRWGLERETCRAHALLFLAGEAMGAADIARALDMTKPKAAAAVADLQQWGMARPAGESAWDASGEPWDLLFAALEARRRRELQPALDMLRTCRDEASGDGTLPGVRQRLGRMQALVEDLAAIDVQARRLPSTTLIRLVGLGGRAARFLARTFPSSHTQRRS